MAQVSTAHPSTTNAYFLARIAELGLDEKQAFAHGIQPDKYGNIIQIIRTFHGRPILWQDRRGVNRRRIEKLTRRKTQSDGAGLEQFDRPLAITRYTPEYLSTRPNAKKYRFPSKDDTQLGVHPMPTNAAIQAFTSGASGGMAMGVEGYFKAVAMSLHGVEATAFSGNTTYRVDDALAEYLMARRLDDFVILYDADAREIKTTGADTVSGKRINDFCASARRFAGQFYDLCKRHGLKTRLHFAMVAETQPHKGADDLLAAADTSTRAGIIQAFNTLQTSEYFTFLRLASSTYERTLKQFFALENHVAFYQKYGHIIQERAFTFGRGTYRAKLAPRDFNLFSRATASTAFELRENPFAVPVDGDVLSVEKYMADASTAMDAIIQARARVCIDAPTGVGKNAYFLGYRAGGRRRAGYFERTGTRGVIAVPTRLLARQLGAKFKIPTLYGTVSIREKERALNAPVVVCTYDTLHHVGDISARVLVVDEAHNLVNQYGEIATNRPFRAATLRRIVERFSVAQKTVLISGTAPRLLAKHFDFHMVEMHRRENNMVHVYAMEAETSSPKALTTALLAELQKENFTDGNIRFVFYNSRAQLEIIRRAMVSAGHLDDKDVAIITRETADDGHPIFSQIISKETISGAKLVLSTCLLAEGVNIGNANVGNIYTVGALDADVFRQYVARFRAVPELHVYAIRPPERALDDAFFTPAHVELEYLLKSAAVQLDFIQAIQREHAADFPDDAAEYFDAIQPNYTRRAELWNMAYQSDDGRYKIDGLRALAAIRERMVETSNNCFFYSEIGRHANIIIQGLEQSDAAARERVSAALDDAAAALDDEKETVLAALKQDLTTAPRAIIQAYHRRVHKAGNRHAAARIKAMAPDLLETDDAAAVDAYMATHGQYFAHAWFTDTINRFLRARFTGMDAQSLADAMDMPAKDFNRMWHQWKTHIEFLIYENRRWRTSLTPQHRADVKTKKMLRAWIDAAAVDGKISAADALKVLREKTSVHRINGAMDGVESISALRLDAAAVERILNAVFDVTVDRYRGGNVYQLKRPAATWLNPEMAANPLKILKLYKEN